MKHLEKDYGKLRTRYNGIKADYKIILEENNKLKAGLD